MGTMRIEVAHRLFPRTWRILVWHREHSLDQIGNRSGILGLFFSGEWPNATGCVVARYAMPGRRARQLWRGRYHRTARAGLLIEVFHFLRPQSRDQTRSLILRRSASARKPGSCNSNGPPWASRHAAVMRLCGVELGFLFWISLILEGPHQGAGSTEANRSVFY